MRLIKRLFAGLLLFLILVFTGLSVYFKFYGGSLLKEALSRSLKKNVDFQTFSYEFPFGLRTGQVRVEDEARADELRAQFYPSSAWTRKFNIKELVVVRGQYQYAQEINDQAIVFTVRDIHLTARDLILPLEPVHTRFHLTGKFIQQDNPLSGSGVEADGWIDVVQKDMEGRLKITDPAGGAGLAAEAVSRNNDMTVQGELKLSNFFAGRGQGAAADSSAVTNLIFGALSSMGVDVGAQFSFKTKMDHFQIGNISFSGSVTADDFSKMLPAVE